MLSLKHMLSVEFEAGCCVEFKVCCVEFEAGCV